MGVIGRAREALQAYRLERRAARLQDPVAKLRCLRRAQAVSADPTGRPAPEAILARVAAAVLLVPSPTASDAWFAATVETPREASSRPPEVWLVEERDGVEYFSNGLRIDNRGAVEGRPRRYPVYDADTLELREWRWVPAGIVYHTTESHIAPFRPEQNPRLMLAGRWMLDYVRRNHSYHFVVDRFGRVHRTVAEEHAANHAGASIWASGGELFVNLNAGFLGIAFETETREPARGAELTPAQKLAGRLLTEMLRARYRIVEANCVTHAQVSVAPAAMLVGNHLDWSANFPFAELGLADNYGQPIAAVAIFGFRFDREFQRATRSALGRGLAAGEELFRRRADSLGRSEPQHRAAVARRYREIVQALRNEARGKEDNSSWAPPRQTSARPSDSTSAPAGLS